jgi:hypothetical protein
MLRSSIKRKNKAIEPIAIQGRSMKEVIIKTLILLSFSTFCYGNPIGKVPSEQKQYVYPKRVAKVQRVPPDKVKDEAWIAYVDDEGYDSNGTERPLAQTKEDKTLAPHVKQKRPYKPFKIDVAPQYSYVIVRSHGMKKNRGHLWGVSGEMEYKKSNHIYGDASFLWNQGDLKSSHHDHSWKEADGRAVVGYTTPIFHRTLMTVFAGFGFRRVLDHKGYAGFHPRVTLNYYQYFIPCGLLIDFDCWDRFGFSLDLKAMPAVDARVQVSNHPGIFWKLSRKMNYEVDLPLTWKAVRGIKADFDVALIPFFKYWDLGGSSRLGLHCRTQTYWGAELLLGLSF